MKDKIWDVAIIGSGPAGLTAGIYTTRGAASTVILGGDSWGGQLMLTTLVENFPGFADGVMGPELMEKMKDQAIKFGAEFVPQSVTSVDFNIAQNNGSFVLNYASGKVLSKTVIIATGAQTKWLEVPGEKELIGRGVSSCAPCDAPFFKEKEVLVVGGGDSAMEEALVLTKYASKITIIHRRDTFKASAVMQEKVLKNEKIKVIWDSEVVEVLGKEKLQSVKLKNIKTNEVSELTAVGMFVAIGHMPDSQIFKGVLEMDEKGFIKRDPSSKWSSETSIPGVFVSGDVHDFTYKQAITAAGYGCQAAMDALNYLVDKS